VIAARRSDDAGSGDRALEQVRERSARLERTRVLELLELHGEAKLSQAEVRAVDHDDGSAADVRRYHTRGRGDGVAP
jgi:hypothetical protein